MSSEKIFMCIMIVFILISIYKHDEIGHAAKETFSASSLEEHIIKPVRDVLHLAH